MSSAAPSFGLLSRIVSQAAGLATVTTAAPGEVPRASIRPVLPYAFDPLPRDAPKDVWPVMSHVGTVTEQPAPRLDDVIPPQSQRSSVRSDVEWKPDQSRVANRFALDMRSDQLIQSIETVTFQEPRLQAAIPRGSTATHDLASLAVRPVSVRLEPGPVFTTKEKDRPADLQSTRVQPSEREAALREPTLAPAKSGNFSAARNFSDGPISTLQSQRNRATHPDVPLRLSAPRSTPSIEVHIGRIEVRTPNVSSRPTATTSAVPQGGSLAAHLWSRSRGARS
jgi:hypothetical protein